MRRVKRLYLYRRFVLLAAVISSIAGCSSDNHHRAPITAIGTQTEGARRQINNDRSTVASRSAATSSNLPTVPMIASSATAHQPVNKANARAINPSESNVSKLQPPAVERRIIYNRNYQSIRKGSYNGNSYTVHHGDTLFYISWISGNDYRDLAEHNHLQPPYNLQDGQVLLVTNSQGQPITGANELSEADSAPSGGTRINGSGNVAIAQQPNITYSEDSGNGTSKKTSSSSDHFLQNKQGVAGSASAPITAPYQVTASSKSAKSAPIFNWLWPTNGKIIDNFSAADGGNKGIDISGAKGQAILATAAGRVVYAGNALRGYGNLIIIKHNDDYLSAYAHNDTMIVHEKQSVTAGQKIATMGTTGTSSVRLHFEIRYKGKSVNPLRFLPQR